MGGTESRESGSIFSALAHADEQAVGGTIYAGFRL